jgi:hypothetical protein
MIKKSINCFSCEVKCDIIVRQSNYEEDEDIEVQYCPICSASIEDNELFVNDYDE